MLAIGLLLNTVGLGVVCWLMFTLAVYILPFFVFVAGRITRIMWRSRICGARAD